MNDLSSRPETISNIQAVRAFAALSVVFYHTNYTTPWGVHTEFDGVAIFFVISGFIMCAVGRSSAFTFAVSRVTRIVPIYWLCTLFVILWGYRLGAFFPSTWTSEFTINLLSSLFFIPAKDTPVLGVGWTLNYEMYFYLVFSLSIVASKRQAPIITAILISAVPIVAMYYPDIPGWALFYARPIVLYFVAGIICFYLWKRLANIANFVAPFFTTAAAIGLLAYLWPPLWHAIAAHVRPEAAIPPLLVLTVLLLHSTGKKQTSKTVSLLGDASYSIYLTHTILFDCLRKYGLFDMAQTKSSFPLAMTYVALSAIIGIVVYKAIEIPMLASIREFTSKLHINSNENERRNGVKRSLSNVTVD